jgi:hypothetical protein
MKRLPISLASPLLALLLASAGPVIGAAPESGAAPAKPTQSATEPEKKGPLYWPEAGRPSFKYGVVERLFDRVPMDFGLLQGAGYKWTTNISDRWVPLSNTPARYSISFREKSGAPLTFGIAVFKPEEFLPDLTAPTWERFLDGLREQNAAAFRIISQASTVEDPLGGPSIFGEPTRELFYQTKAYPSGVVTQLGLFVFHKGQLLVFSLIGPEQMVRRSAEEFRLLVGQFAAD